MCPDDAGQARPSFPEVSVPRQRKQAKQRKTEHVVHNMDGTISERYSYGNDPASRSG